MITQTKEMADARRKWLFAKKMALRAQSEGRFNTIYETSTRVHRADYLRLRSVWNAPAAALAEAEAEVARLRAALKDVAGIAGRASFNYAGDVADVFRLLCAIAITDTNETAPAGEA